MLDSNNKLTPLGRQASINYALDRDVQDALLESLRTFTPLEYKSNRGQKVIEVLGLANDNGTLSDYGRIRAIELLSLRAQCQILDLNLNTLTLTKRNPVVEVDALTFFINERWRGVPYEGNAFLFLITAMCRDVLIDFIREDLPREVEIKSGPLLPGALYRWPIVNRTPENRRRRLIDEIRESGSRQIKRGFQAFFRGSSLEREFPLISEKFLQELFDSLGTETIVNLAKFIMDDPFHHRFGWPDLTLIREGIARFVEIKVGDKLRFYQIQTFDKLRFELPALEVIRITRKSDDCSTSG